MLYIFNVAQCGHKSSYFNMREYILKNDTYDVR